MYITEGGLDDPRVVELLDIHITRALAEGRGSGHALDLAALMRAPDLTFWSAWEDDTRATLVGIVALRTLSSEHGEVKSMHVAERMRGRGYGAAMVQHIIAAARARGMSRLSLETGSWPFFAPARALYARHGFEECEPFDGYVPDPSSVFMTLGLR
jgi:putative acetyltransferase